jgi:hypothetical protein
MVAVPAAEQVAAVVLMEGVEGSALIVYTAAARQVLLSLQAA